MKYCFFKGNKYVFTKKKFIQSEGKLEYNHCKAWVNACNGREVFIEQPIAVNACYRGFSISRQWCKCIKQINTNIGSESNE